MTRVNVGRVTLRSELIALGREKTLINEVALANGQSLYGVRVIAVESNFVTLSESGSAGMTNVIVPLDQIVYVDTDKLPCVED